MKKKFFTPLSFLWFILQLLMDSMVDLGKCPNQKICESASSGLGTSRGPKFNPKTLLLKNFTYFKKISSFSFEQFIQQQKMCFYWCAIQDVFCATCEGNMKLNKCYIYLVLQPPHPLNSVQRIFIFPANRNKNRFADPNSVQIVIRRVCEFPNLQIRKEIEFFRWKVFTKYSLTPDIYIFFVPVLDSYILLIRKNLAKKKNIVWYFHN